MRLLKIAALPTVALLLALLPLATEVKGQSSTSKAKELGVPHTVYKPEGEAKNVSKTFTNPLGRGADPYIVKHDGKYYSVKGSGRGFAVTESRFLTKPETRSQVWIAPDTLELHNFWAPELHHIDGKWYIYFAASEKPGTPYSGQRTRVLESDTPLGAYTYKGTVYTGFNPDRSTDNLWAIDMTVMHVGGKKYAVWSGWDALYDHHDVDQHLMIAEMINPWTLGRPVLLSSPELEWEQGDHIKLLEGPQILYHGDDVFILYSTRGSWSEHYKIGQLRLRPGADPLVPRSWIKSPQPVFQGTATVYGVGHASMTTSPDDKEYWIYYHSKKAPEGGWGNREVYLQRFGFGPDGNPRFGKPSGAGEMQRPSGEVEIEKAILRGKDGRNSK